MGREKDVEYLIDSPIIKRLEFEKNEMYQHDNETTIMFNVQFGVDEIKENRTTIVLDLTAGEKSEKQPFFMEISIKSSISWSENRSDEEMKELIQATGRNVLISYVRPWLTQLTVDSGLPPLVIPFI